MIQKYGDWTIIDETPIRKNGKLYFKCQCKCGIEQDVYYYSLKKGGSKSCHSCASKKHLPCEAFQKSWKGKVIGELNRTMFGHIKSKATERNLEFTVTQQFLSDLFEKQGRRCALSNLPIALSLKIKNGNPNFAFITASLDRIDSSLGYTENNVQWVHKIVNQMKMELKEDLFLSFCKAIVDTKFKTN